MAENICKVTLSKEIVCHKNK